MKIAFISDIHGNAVALEAVLDDVRTKNIDKIIVLGDIAFRGPEPKRALELVRELDTSVIKGNADEWLVRGISRGEVPDKVLEIMKVEQEWASGKLSREEIDYLKNLPIELTDEITDHLKIHAFHATPDSLFKQVRPSDEDEMIESSLVTDATADIILYGHIHLPYVRFLNGKCIANLGSVGLPFDGKNAASYLIIEAESERFSIQIQRVPYDVDKVIHQLKEVNYPNFDVLAHMIKKGVSV